MLKSMVATEHYKGDNQDQGFSSLNYAACHSCVLLPETSCEFRNVLLDRGAVVGRPENPKIGVINYIGIEV